MSSMIFFLKIVLVTFFKLQEALGVLQWLLGSNGTHAQDALERLRREQAGAVKSATVKQFCKESS